MSAFRPRTLYHRLLLSHLLVIVVTALIAGTGLLVLADRYTAHTQHAELMARAQELADLFEEVHGVEFLRRADELVSADILIVDRRGEVVVSSSDEGDDLREMRLRTDDVERIERQQALRRHWLRAPWGPTLAVAAPVSGADGFEGTLVLRRSAPSGDQPLNLLRAFIPWTLGATVIASAGLAWWLAHGLNRPLKAMTDTATAIASGDFSRRVEIASGPDEVLHLAHTLNLAADEMEHALEEQKRLDRARRDFVANVSHELKAPLASLRMFLELSREEGSSRDARELSEGAMLNEVKRLSSMVDEMLELARLESGQVQVELASVDVGHVFNELVDGFRAQARRTDVQLQTDIGDSTVRVMADPRRIYQVLANLVRNALQHTPSGGSVSLYAHAGDDGKVRIGVRDTGRGIAEEDLPFIFDRFYTVDKARTPREDTDGGTGLGLAIAWELVSLHDSTLQAASRLREGSDFYFYLHEAA